MQVQAQAHAHGALVELVTAVSTFMQRLARRAARDSLLRGVLAADGDPASFPVGRSAGEAVPTIESGRTLLVFSDGMRVARPIAGSSDPSALPARFSGVI